MLAKILSNFSEVELLSFLPKNSINFALQIDARVNQISESNSYNKSKLASIAASVKPVDFILISKTLVNRFFISLARIKASLNSFASNIVEKKEERVA